MGLVELSGSREGITRLQNAARGKQLRLRPNFLSQELAVCYVMSVLLPGDSYGTELINRLESEYPDYRLSDTIIHNSLKSLGSAQAISGYWKKVEGRGRPRRMYHLEPQWFEQAAELARLWKEYSLSYSRHSSRVGKVEV